MIWCHFNWVFYFWCDFCPTEAARGTVPSLILDDANQNKQEVYKHESFLMSTIQNNVQIVGIRLPLTQRQKDRQT